MALTVTTVDKLPPVTRNKKRSLEGTDEWAQLKAKFAEGLRPHEAVYITFSPDQIKKLGIKTTGRVFLAMAREYIQKLKLPYDVWRYHTEGQEVICVAARGVGIGVGAKEIQAPAGRGSGARGGKHSQHKRKSA